MAYNDFSILFKIDFKLFINDNEIGDFTPTYQNLTADEWVIDPPYDYFHEGNNTIRFNFTGNSPKRDCICPDNI